MMAKVPVGGGGRPTERGVMNYKPPVGPTNINDPRGVGIHGPSVSRQGTQCQVSGPLGTSSGSPGINRIRGGENLGNCGTQGKR